MKKRQIKIGDLVKYNAAGMRDKTLGVVYAIDTFQVEYEILPRRTLLIHWVVKDKLLPRTSRFGYRFRDDGIKPWDNDADCPNWFDDESWIEIANLE